MSNPTAPGSSGTQGIVSKRGLKRLAEMQHQLITEVRSLSEQHSRLLGALMACDMVTQQGMMMEYRDQLYAVHAVLAKLRLLLDRYCEDSDEPSDS